LQQAFVSRLPNLEVGGPPLVGCQRLLIQTVYHPYLEAVSSIRNLKTRHVVVTESQYYVCTVA